VQFPLHPETPPGGMLLRDLFKGRAVDIGAMQAQMKERMAAEGLAYAPQDRILNSRLAQELSKWAEAKGAPRIDDALFRAYFVEGADISNVDALVQIAEKAGLDGAEARRALEERTMRDAVDADWAQARALGITGVPTFVVGKRGVVGAQPYEVLERLLVQSGAQRRS
jgi:predicted DsbA family dithiol-disulfide isomerase